MVLHLLPPPKGLSSNYSSRKLIFETFRFIGGATRRTFPGRRVLKGIFMFTRNERLALFIDGLQPVRRRPRTWAFDNRLQAVCGQEYSMRRGKLFAARF